MSRQPTWVMALVIFFVGLFVSIVIRNYILAIASLFIAGMYYWAGDPSRPDYKKPKWEIKKTEFIKHPRHIPNDVRLQVKIKYNYRCAFCHRTEKEVGTLHHIDHIIPVSKGGKSHFNNLQLLCTDCNLKKRDKW